MCTLSFLPRGQGYFLAMNRDERRTRNHALPPVLEGPPASRLTYPSEPGGGTWIGLESHGNAFALLNWARPRRLPESGSWLSRGELIPHLLDRISHPSSAAGCGRSAGVPACDDGGGRSPRGQLPDLVTSALHDRPLDRFRPFRLFGFFPRQRSIFQWRWDGLRLEQKPHPWQTMAWFSSGYAESRMQRARRLAFRLLAPRTPNALRVFHASHFPRHGPASVCMHRPDARTVSYTEIDSHPPRLTYLDGSPCRARPLRTPDSSAVTVNL